MFFTGPQHAAALFILKNWLMTGKYNNEILLMPILFFTFQYGLNKTIETL
jgi:hypothetical protein